MFKETHPIVGTRDIQRAIEFYTSSCEQRTACVDRIKLI
jgi:hypothetical protein